MAPRFSASPFTPMVRPPNFPRPPLPTVSTMPLLSRPPGNILRPGLLVLPSGSVGTDMGTKMLGPLFLPEKPQTTVYVGKIASTVDDDFLRSLLELCGPIKSWKRAQDPSGSPKGFGFCEFESAEGVLRALRILNKFSLEGQELVLNVNLATREYLERYVQRKTEREKQMKEEASQVADTEVETAPGVEVPEPAKQSAVEAQKNDSSTDEHGIEENGKKLGIVNNEDKDADEEAQKKLKSVLEERARLRPLPPPPPLPNASEVPVKSNSVPEGPGKSRDGDSGVDGGKTDGYDGKNEEETSENKASSELDRPETSSSDRGRRLDQQKERERDKDRDRVRNKDREKGRGRERDRDRERDRGRDWERERERESKRERERELERYERDRERERARREREREMRLRDAELFFEERERWWEDYEKEKERQRNIEREREKERERQRRREIKDQEEESDDEGWRKRRHRGETYDERRKRCRREREEDEEDRIREEQEIAEAERQKTKEENGEVTKKKQTIMEHIEVAEPTDMVIDETEVGNVEPEVPKNIVTPSSDSKEQNSLPDGEEVSKNGGSEIGIEEDVRSSLVIETDGKANSSPAPRKLGFGLMGSGKRTAIPSVFHQEEEDEASKDHSLRQLVPIDYSPEEMQVVSSSKPTPLGGANLAAAAEFAKSLSLGNSSAKEGLKSERDRAKGQRDRLRETDKNYWERDQDRSKDKDREREREDMDRFREREKEKYRNLDSSREKERSSEKSNTTHNRKLLDAKQLIDTIPKTKEELFAYNVDWAIYDQHDLHERMRPWISKKITEFLGEEEVTLVDLIVTNTRKHVTAAYMLELLENILDDEAEMFVLKMWRMLIFEIRKVETGMSLRLKS